MRTASNIGAELTATYDINPFSACTNFSIEQAMGKDIVSSQFSFSPSDLAYIEENYIHLDHERYTSMSVGASYSWDATVFSADMLVGSGLRADGAVPNGDKLPAYVQINTGVSHAFDLGPSGDLTARFDIVNLFNTEYEIRDGTASVPRNMVPGAASSWGFRNRCNARATCDPFITRTNRSACRPRALRGRAVPASAAGHRRNQ